MPKRMRALLWGVLLSLLCAPAVFAGTVTLQINNPPSNNVLDGIYVGPYAATNTQTGAGTGIICDDFKDESNYNAASYTVNSFSNLGSTLWGSQLLKAGDTMSQITALYEQAGWLALGMGNQTGTQQGYYSYALWAVFDASDVLSWLKNSGDLAACNAIFGTNNNCTSAKVTAGGLLYNAEQNYASGNYSSLLVLTPTGCGAMGCPEQEFFQPQPVPEGGAAVMYLLLAGGVCFGAIFRSRRQNARMALA